MPELAKGPASKAEGGLRGHAGSSPAPSAMFLICLHTSEEVYL